MSNPNLSRFPANHPLRLRDAADGITLPGPSPADLRGRVVKYVQAQLDAKARAKGYDNILSACTYATSSNTTFAAEGQAFMLLRDNSWSVCYQILRDVEAGLRPMPTFETVVAELPQGLK